jgi:hypothetical protein
MSATTLSKLPACYTKRGRLPCLDQRRTYKTIGILLETDGANKISTFLDCPFRDDSFWETVGAAAVAVGSRSMLCGRRELRVYRRMLRVGDGRAHASLVFVVGIGLGVGCATIKAHHPDGYEGVGANS